MAKIDQRGRVVTTLRGKQAATFLVKIAGADQQAAQLAMASATGHFKHGNERR